LKAAIYCRVSTKEQDTENQIALCQSYCAREGIEVYRVYSDNGVSGAKTSRPAFNEMLEDMRSNRFSCLVVVKLDRIGRSLQHLVSIIEELSARGIHLIVVTQGINTARMDAAAKMQIQMLGVFAEYERNINSERTIEGLDGKENVGKRGPDKKPRLKRGGLRKPLITFKNSVETA
jgi:DNA invertase Pin-like site-specific DNA recombinase